MRPDTLMMSEPMNLISAAVAGAIKAMLIPIAAKNLFTVISARIINPRRQFLSIVGSPRRVRRRTTRRAGGSAGRPPLFDATRPRAIHGASSRADSIHSIMSARSTSMSNKLI